MSAQAQKLEIFEKNALSVVRSLGKFHDITEVK